MGVLAVVGAGSPGSRGGEGETRGGVGRRGDTIQRGSDAVRDAGPVLKSGRTKVVT